MTSQAAARLVRATKRYREGSSDRAVLRELSLEIPRGRWLAITGRSGSGKSTLLNLLAGLDVPTSGEVWIGDRRISHEPETERALVRSRAIGFVHQFFNLIPTLTVVENLMLALELRSALDASSTRRAHELLERVGLGGRGATFPDRLSGGEQQRAAIARALVHDPALVLADEPTGNLDDETSASVVALFEELLRRDDRALVIVTHSRELAQIADVGYRMHAGVLEPL